MSYKGTEKKLPEIAHELAVDWIVEGGVLREGNQVRISTQLIDALAEIERGVDLDPVSGHSFHSEGFIYYFSRRYDQALSLIRTVRSLDVNPPDWSFLLGDVYAEKGMYEESIAAFLKSGNGPYSLAARGRSPLCVRARL